MKVVMPLAGKGTRLRPHTHVTPKPLLKVGDKPVLAYILDELRELGVGEAVCITGHLKERVEEFMAREYPDFKAVYVEQVEQRGTGDAIALAEPYVEEDLLIIFVDTLFDADLSLVKRLPADVAGVIWAKEVEDYQRFGVIVTDEHGFMQKIIEKPSEPVSKLANIGLYYIRDWKLLFEGIRHVMSTDPGVGGEYFLTDAFQYMVDHGGKLLVAPVAGWYDAGKPDTLLDTNLHVLSTTRGRSPAAADDPRARPRGRRRDAGERRDRPQRHPLRRRHRPRQQAPRHHRGREGGDRRLRPARLADRQQRPGHRRARPG